MALRTILALETFSLSLHQEGVSRWWKADNEELSIGPPSTGVIITSIPRYPLHTSSPSEGCWDATHQSRSCCFTTSPPAVTHLIHGDFYPIRDWVNIVMLLLLLHININEANIQTFLGPHKNPLSRRGFTFEESDKEKPIFWCESNSAYLGLCEGWRRETGEV